MNNLRDIQDFFKENNYVIIKNFISDDMTLLFYEYVKTYVNAINHKIAYDKNYYEDMWDGSFTDGQVSNSFWRYGDPLFDTVMKLLHEKIENHLNIKLYNNYSYFRLYQSENELVKHKDRPSCEISSTLCVGYNVENVDKEKYPNYCWPIWLKNNKDEIPISLKPGDILLYRGAKIEHWREKFLGLNHAQVFMHYNEVGGKFNIQSDNRPHLGIPYKPSIYFKE